MMKQTMDNTTEEDITRASLAKKLTSTRVMDRCQRDTHNITVAQDTTLGSVIGLMHTHNRSIIPVVEDGVYIGSVSHKEIMTRNLPHDATTTAVNRELPTLSEEDTLESAVCTMHEHFLTEIVVLKEDRLCGILQFKDIARWLKSQEESRKISLHELPRKPIPTVDETITIDDARVNLRGRNVDELIYHEHDKEVIEDKSYLFQALRFPRKRMQPGHFQPEKHKSLDADIDYFADLVYPQAQHSDTLHMLLEKMEENNFTLVAQVNDWVISAHDIIAYLADLFETDEVTRTIEEKVRIIAVRHKSDTDSQAQIGKHLHHFVRHFADKFDNERLKELRITIKEHKPHGNQHHYEVICLCITDFGRFHAHKEGFNEIVSIEEALRAINNQIKYTDTV